VDAAVKKLLEIANGLEPDHAGRINVGAINARFMSAGGDPPEYSAAVKAAIDRGYMTIHPSGGYLSFTPNARWRNAPHPPGGRDIDRLQEQKPYPLVGSSITQCALEGVALP
jgi:hypothetical protein